MARRKTRKAPASATTKRSTRPRKTKQPAAATAARKTKSKAPKRAGKADARPRRAKRKAGVVSRVTAGGASVLTDSAAAMARPVSIRLGPHPCGDGHPLVIIAGLCVIESRNHTLRIAERLKKILDRAGLPFIFKASFDKANRSSVDAYRGPGIVEGLHVLEAVGDEVGVPVLTDIHRVEQADSAAEVVDVLQIPAFLCRQTDLLQAAGKTGCAVNIKKGQFLSPEDMANAADKVRATGNADILLTERGVSFGYHRLVVDFRGLPIMRQVCHLPVCFDATHSVQEPGGLGQATGGRREFIQPLARAAVAVGVDALFFEVHDHPDAALSDGPNALPLDTFPALLDQLRRIDEMTRM